MCSGRTHGGCRAVGGLATWETRGLCLLKPPRLSDPSLMATCYDCGNITQPGERRCSACQHWNLGMTRRIISAVKYDSAPQPDAPANTPQSDAAAEQQPRSYIDPSFVVEIDRMGQPVREFNDYIVVI